jgi:uncharacterized protein involved in response to NO
MTAERNGATLAIEGLDTRAAEPFGLWGRAFRPFFLGLGLQAVLVLPWWTLAWIGILATPAWLTPMAWHGHEMVFGFAAAAIAGFLLTASPVWSGGPALTGRPLAALFALWVAGRVAFAAAGVLPAWLVAVVDLSFLPLVAAAVVRTLRGSGQVRNYAVVGLVATLAAANAAVHAEACGLTAGVAQRGLRFAVDLVVVLILVIGGRITPAFTRNAFRRRGLSIEVRSWPLLDGATLALAGATAASGLVLGRTAPTGLVAVAAGLCAAARLAGWRSWHVRGDPLLWSLHAATAWVVVGLVLVGLGDLGAPVPATAGLHALTAGAIGSAILAVATRVGLGHTGRPLEPPAGVVGAYVLVHAAALLRVATPFLPGDVQPALLVASGLGWACAYGLFTLRYWPILATPRPDGRPG